MKLEIGYNHSFEIRHETCYTNCLDDFSIIYISDLHLNKFSKSIAERISIIVEKLNPTIILLGGDYIDAHNGLFYFNKLLRSLSHRKNIFAIAGNHDYYYGLDEIKKCIEENNVVWIEKKSYSLTIGKTKIKIDGNMINHEINNNDYSILLLHKPKNINQFSNYYNLAFAGHLHGSQIVLWQSDNKLYPGKFFYKWNILKTKINNCNYFISKGLGDTLPIRYNCKRELLFIQAINNNNNI